MNEQRKVCAESLYQDKNCCYSKVVDEKGEYPVITFEAKVKNGVPDLSTMDNVKTRVDKTCLCVYCTHPNHSKEKFVGSVEPYFPCYAPNDCPEMQKTFTRKPTLWERFKNFFKK